MGKLNNKNTPPKPKIPKLTPVQRLVLTLWTLILVVLSLFFFRRFGTKVMLLMIVVVPLIGMLFGMRMLDKFDKFGKALGLIPAEPKPKPPSGAVQFKAFVEFLRSQQERGEFTKDELRSYCNTHALEYETLLQLGQQKKWFREMGSAMVITCSGMEMLGAQTA
jgi:uncharacterized membrane protein YwzB